MHLTKDTLFFFLVLALSVLNDAFLCFYEIIYFPTVKSKFVNDTVYLISISLYWDDEHILVCIKNISGNSLQTAFHIYFIIFLLKPF